MAKTTKRKNTKRNRLNHDRIVKLYKSLDKSVTAVAKKVHASYMGVRRVLILEGRIRKSRA